MATVTVNRKKRNLDHRQCPECPEEADAIGDCVKTALLPDRNPRKPGVELRDRTYKCRVCGFCWHATIEVINNVLSVRYSKPE